MVDVEERDLAERLPEEEEDGVAVLEELLRIVSPGACRAPSQDSLKAGVRETSQGEQRWWPHQMTSESSFPAGVKSGLLHTNVKEFTILYFATPTMGVRAHTS